MAESDVDSGPRLAVRSLRSKFEQMALDVSPNPQISHSRSPSGTLMLSEPGSPRPRAASSSMHAVPPDAHYLRATSSSSDLKVAGKRPPPPPPPPPRGSKAPPSPFGSPLLRPVPVPSFSPSTSTVSLDSSISTNSILASTNPSVLADYESPSTSPSRSVASLRNKFATSPASSPPRSQTPRQSLTASYPSLFFEQNPPSASPPSVPPRPLKPVEPSRFSLSHPTSCSPLALSPSPSRLSPHSPFIDDSEPHPSLSHSPPPLPTRSYAASSNSDLEREALYKSPGTRSTSSSRTSSESDGNQSMASPVTITRANVPVPPRPPPRLRHATVSSIDSSSNSLSPPPLPIRRGTIQTAEESQQVPPPLPVRPIASPVTDAEQSTSYLKSSSVHRLPPPPTRTIALGDKLPPARRPPSPSSDEESGDEDDPKARAVDSLPDSSRSSRRPPALSAHQYSEFKVHVPPYTGHVVVSGEYIVVASHHHVKVFNLSVSDSHVFSLDSKDVGAKELKVTSMEFRPAAKENERGFFLWLGTKDGHLFELDIRSGVVVGTKLSAHSHTVTHIFRHGRSMISLDDTGKTLIFTPDPASREDVRLGYTQPRVYRIAEKHDFAKVFRGRLWTSARSDVNGGGNVPKTPIIRVYDVYAPGSTGRTMLPTEHVGAITSGAVLPSHPNHVYLGHEGGFISIWALEGKDGFPYCIEAMKVSVSDVLSLDGVNDRLWAGGRKGMITAYDVHPRPWIVTNCWMAHNELPVLKLAVDYYGIKKLGRLRVLSAGRDEQVRFWDGLLGSDWIDQELLKRETSFSTFRQMKVLMVSWNADSARPDSLTGEAANVNFLHDALQSVESPDIISFGLQEVIDLESRRMTAKNVLLGKKKDDGGLSEKVTGAYKRWHDRLLLAVRLAMPPDAPYSVVHTESLVGMFSCIFVKNTERLALQDVAVTTIKRGMGGRYGNKGGILMRFVVDDSSICFINCHLAAGQNHVRQRNGDVAAFVEDKDLFPVTNALVEPLAYVGGGDGSMVLDHEIVFVSGDMNYRIDQRRDAIVATVNAGEYESLFAYDQLLREMKHNRGFRFRSFAEGPLAFAPTYKYDRRSSEYDSSEKRRLPAWCDRVLWRSCDPGRVRQLHYRRYEANVSDHRPISAGFAMTVKAVRHDLRARVKMEVERMWVGEQARLLDVGREFYVREALI